MTDIVEKVARAFSDEMGPPFGNPEFIAEHKDRLQARIDRNARKYADIAVATFKEAGMVIVPVEPTERMVRGGMYGMYMAEWSGINDCLTFNEYLKVLEKKQTLHLAETQVQYILREAMIAASQDEKNDV